MFDVALAGRDRGGGGRLTGEESVLKQQAQQAFGLFMEIFSGSYPPSAFAQVQSIVKIESKQCLADDGSLSAFIIGSTVYIKVNGQLQCEDSAAFKQLLVALLELTEDILRCDQLILCLDRASSQLQPLMKSLLYIGFELVGTPSLLSATISQSATAPPSPALVFLGYSI